MANKVFFDQSLTDLVKKRFSCRSFDGRGLEPEMLESLERFPAALKLPFRNPVRFGIIDKEAVRAENLFSGGSYGLIKGVRYYLSALVKKGAPRCWEDVGFGLEVLVLRATALDLGSCWIGGIFDRKRFGRTLGILEDEMLPAVIAVGRPAEKRSWRQGRPAQRSRSAFFQHRLADPLFLQGFSAMVAGFGKRTPGAFGVQQAALAHHPPE
jgi:nitroreductase